MKDVMAPIVSAYLIGLLTFAGVFGGYFFFYSKAKFEKKLKTAHRYQLIVGVLAALILFFVIFFVPMAIAPKAGIGGAYEGGMVALNGLPFVDNPWRNFACWLALSLFLSAASMAIVVAITDSERGKLLNRYILLPLLLITSILFYAVEKAWSLSDKIDYRIVTVAILVGFSLGVSVVVDVRDRQEGKKPLTGFGKLVLSFLFLFLMTMPVSTFANFIPTDWDFLWRPEFLWTATDFSLAHRVFFYVGLAGFIFLYFFGVDKDYATKKTLLLIACFGALTSYLSQHGFAEAYGSFEAFNVHPRELPIHLCDLSLFLLPLAILFHWKRLHTAILLFVSFGAFMALLFPTVGLAENIFDPLVIAYWRSHITLLFVPILAMAWRMFERPRLKRMLFAQLLFVAYFAIAMLCNGFLSTLVPGYNPNVVGSGTDYFFLNGTHVLRLFGDGALDLLKARLFITDTSGHTLVYYPFYQGLFLLIYMLIGAALWGGLFVVYIVEDSHEKLRYIRRRRKKDKREWRANMVYRLERYEIIDHRLPRLLFDDLVYTYEGQKDPTVDHFSLTLESGEIVAFIGEEGSGKSTCLQCACGFLPVQSGRIEVCGFDIRHEPSAAKHLIGYCFENNEFYEKMTGRNYINYLADLYGIDHNHRVIRISRDLALFGLTDVYNQKITTYTQEQKHLLAIMGSLIHRPKIWILDEPFYRLSEESTARVKEAIAVHAKQGNIVVFSSRSADGFAEMLSKTIVLKDGKIFVEEKEEEGNKGPDYIISLDTEEEGGKA